VGLRRRDKTDTTKSGRNIAYLSGIFQNVSTRQSRRNGEVVWDEDQKTENRRLSLDRFSIRGKVVEMVMEMSMAREWRDQNEGETHRAL